MKLIQKIKNRLGRLFSKYNRNLLTELILADFKAYDHNSVLGVFWSLLNPLVMLLVMYCVFENRFVRGDRFYPLYLLVGITTVNFFISVTGKVIRSIPANRNILLNSTVLREDFILADMFVGAYKFVIELILCWGMSFFYGLFFWKSLFFALPLLAAYVGIVSGVGFIVALLHCFAVDIEHIWRIVSRLLLFISPVFYKLHNISPAFSKVIYWANPITPFLIAFRELIVDKTPINLANYFYCIFLGAGFFIFGYFVFIIFENKAIERI